VQDTSFWSLNIGHLVEIGSLILATLALWFDRKKDARERKLEQEKFLVTQTRMHEENRNRLESLAKFQGEQESLNDKRDEQVSELKQQTSSLAEIARGFNRRLEMIENRRGT
jgi:hypothetical protein